MDYTVKNTKKGQVIEIDKGFYVEYEILWDFILMQNLLKQEGIETVSGRYEDFVKFKSKVKITIEVL